MKGLELVILFWGCWAIPKLARFLKDVSDAWGERNRAAILEKETGFVPERFYGHRPHD